MGHTKSAVPPLARHLFSRILLCASTVAAFWTPMLATFQELDVPLMTRPSAILLGGIGLPGLVLGGAAAFLSPRADASWRRRVGLAVVLAGILLVALDMAVGGHRVLDTLTPQLTSAVPAKVARLGALTAVFGAILALTYALGRHGPTLLVLCGLSAFFVTGATLAWQRVGASVEAARSDAHQLTATDEPPVIYLVLDEAMGVDGVRLAPGGEMFAAALVDVFERHGFRLHEKAFSRHFVSARSIPNTLNFDDDDNSYGPILRHSDGGRVQSRLFAQLAGEGYEVVSYGTRHIDFCFDSAARCEVLPSFNPFSPFISNEAMKAAALYELVRYSMRESYLVYHYTAMLSARQPSSLPSTFTAFDAYAFPGWFDKLTDDVLTAPRGRAYFAHVLMPHSPFVLDSGCAETGLATVAYFLEEEHGLTGVPLEEARSGAYAQYFQQYACLLGRLDGLLTQMGARREFDDATIVVHGDHGSRISAGQYAETVSPRDLLDNYSTLYAIRAPGVAAGRSARQASVQRLTAEYLGEAPPQDPAAQRTVVVDSSRADEVRLLPMPDADDLEAESTAAPVGHPSTN